MIPASVFRPARYVLWRVLCKAALVILLASAPVSAQTLRLVAFGDSLTHGFGLKQGDGFVPQLQRWLKARGHDVNVINMGVSGDTTAGGRARLGWALAPAGWLLEPGLELAATSGPVDRTTAALTLRVGRPLAPSPPPR